MLPAQTQPPNEPIRRRHAPVRAGYRNYRACLRWEFGFTCAFCLLHESDVVEGGARGSGLMTIEHHVPQSADPSLSDAYDNCFYACVYRNRRRGIAAVIERGLRLLDPCSVAWADHFVVVGDELRPRDGDDDAARTHAVYGIDAPKKVEYRLARRERIEEALKAIRECPEEIDRFRWLAESAQGVERRAFLDGIERLRQILRQARKIVDRYQAIPVDRDDECGCVSPREVPGYLARQEVGPISIKT